MYKALQIIIFCFPAFGLAQAPTVLWSKCYGGLGTETGHSIIQAKENGFILLGRTDYESGQVIGYHAGGNCPAGPCADAWVVRVDSLGDFQWQKCLGGSDEEGMYSINTTSDSGYILTGGTYSNNGDVSGNHGLSDVWLVKLNSSGSIEWQKCLGGSNYEFASPVFETKDKGFILGGTALSNNGNVSGNHSIDTADIWVVKTDSAGTIEWQKCLGGSRDDGGSVLITSDQNYFVYSYVYSNDGDVTFNHSQQQDFWLARLDSSGGIVWQKSYGGSASDYPVSATRTLDNGFAVLGTSSSTDGDVTGLHGSRDYWAIKIDSTGFLKWQRACGGSMMDDATCIIQSADGGFLLAGGTNSNDGDVVGHHGIVDGWIVKLDSAGQLQWQKCIGGSDGEAISSMIETPDGEILTLGYSFSVDGDLLGTTNHGNGDMWLAKLSSPYTGIFAPLSPITDFKTYLNPLCRNLCINFYANGNEKIKVQLLDITGRLFLQQPLKINAGLNKQEVYPGELSSGIYLVRLVTETGSVTKKVIKN